MSSNAYFAELHPEPKLRLVVLVTGMLACLAGVFLVLWLPLAASHRAIMTSAWLVLCGRELTVTWRGYVVAGAIRIGSDAAIEVRLSCAEWRGAVLLPGSIVLPGIAWLRLSVGGGPAYGELLSGNPRISKDWRRLQVIWRYIGAAI